MLNIEFELKQYIHIQNEIVALQEEIKKNNYGKEVKTLLQSRVKELKARTKKTEKFIAQIEDDYIRDIMQQKYILGLNWVELEISLGGGASEGSLRMMIKRYLKKVENTRKKE
mgnify:CR=1 FL=1